MDWKRGRGEAFTQVEELFHQKWKELQEEQEIDWKGKEGDQSVEALKLVDAYLHTSPIPKDEKPEGVEAHFRLRGTTQSRTLQVAKVINCTGPRTDYSKYQHPLLINLLARGLIDHDPLALGIRATAQGEVLRYRGGTVGWLYTLGAPLKGDLWECTAMPEIRTQARDVAQALLGVGT